MKLNKIIIIKQWNKIYQNIKKIISVVFYIIEYAVMSNMTSNISLTDHTYKHTLWHHQNDDWRSGRTIRQYANNWLRLWMMEVSYIYEIVSRFSVRQFYRRGRYANCWDYPRWGLCHCHVTECPCVHQLCHHL